PEELVQRVSHIDDPDLEGVYLANGRVTRERLESLLGPDWTWQGKRVLDFGCGAGRTLRHLLDTGAELHGCDVHGPSVDWLAEHLWPPLRVHRSGERPPLPYADGTFDLVYALSVFTHLVDTWDEWLAELRRVLGLVEPGARVLEFGCASGYMSQALGDRRGATVVGVELDAEAAQLAAAHAERVLVGDAEELDIEAELGAERFDAIVFADVLEHL